MAPAKGYANGVMIKDGRLFLGSQIGRNAQQVFETHDFIGQMEQSLRHILAVVKAAGGSAESNTRLTWFVIEKREYMTMVVGAGFVEDDALIEIEATAAIN